MVISFLFGNGLDMQCKLDTSYYSFFKYILEKKFKYILDVEFNSKNEEEVNRIVEQNKANVKSIDNLIYKYIVELQVNKDENWVDLERNLGLHTNYLYEKYGKDSKIANDFIFSLEELREDLEQFLMQQQVLLDKKIDEDFSEILKNTLRSFHSQLKPKKYQEIKDFIGLFTNESIVYKFISLNYTNTLEFILKNCKETKYENNLTSSTNYSLVIPKDVIHAHGVIGDALTLGVNDESQMSCDLFENDEHIYLIKPKLIEEDSQLMKETAENVIRESNLIILFGVSLGETDKEWWNFIGSSMLKNSKQKLLIHDFVPGENNKTSSVKSVMRRKIIEKKFLDYLVEADEEKNILKNNIFILENSKDILNIDLSQYSNKNQKDEQNNNK